ncbi:MAG TPA: MarR family winged helix-turn-helix transcriptional regulator [Aliidongia sp.]|uniref:MarR family winged helix-turn-helix transcriptional regulator n=1 Tax=Aliidongia sp. TaxID=1914230 RepID=UPI002DDCCCDD|nr:MarR family winged helix-turn-helix transcriptional regulator [Aliidongia sp.]HEV2677927.1 MarR family winged helix-turn-helix transcriptional regulator [Aliidongia sp.]
MKQTYLDMISVIEHLHRQFLDLVSAELERSSIQDINSVQANILFNIGPADLTVGELTLNGCYLGSNVSYNVKKLVEADYLLQQRSSHDRRLVRVRLSPKGLALVAEIDAMHDRHLAQMTEGPLNGTAVADALTTLRRVDRFWHRMAEQSQPPLSTFASRAA